MKKKVKKKSARSTLKNALKGDDGGGPLDHLMADSKADVMGIINITPNSFSDGGDYFYQENKLRDRLQVLIENPEVAIIDIGAQSTAPSSSPISLKEEISRFQDLIYNLLKKIDKNKFENRIAISIDTYRLETFYQLYSWLRSNLGNELKIYWNDVSGHLDSEVVSLLNSNFDWGYIWTYNALALQAGREEVPGHIKFKLTLQREEIIEHAIKFFNGPTLLNKERIIFDPGFGFAKSREQNIYLAQNLSTLVRAFPLSQRWLIGVSRKSFLRRSQQVNTREESIIVGSERIHTYLLVKWMHELKGYDLTWRVHDLSVVSDAKFISKSYNVI